MRTVTVITPTMNAAATLQTCLNSVSAQSYPILEHIVVDGASSDDTVEIARYHGAKVLSGPDHGLYHAMSRGVAQARGDIVHILNADDCYSHDKVVSLVVQKMAEESLDLCHAKVVFMDGAQRLSVAGGATTKKELLRKQRVAHPSVFVRKGVYERFGAYSPSFRIAGDTDWLLRVWDEVRVGFMDEELVEMQVGGLSHRFFFRSYKEAFAAALIHGQSLSRGLYNLFFQLIVHVAATKLRSRKSTD